ncbi:hypothetical protein AMJ49_02330 [Parcubacteria bacterium DG_74_2]|nr:MAG: hypothetical protein AMJ49_02330 [Parcubacteria bacterium DG_74_2]
MKAFTPHYFNIIQELKGRIYTGISILKNGAGFTLLEILILVGIIIILTSFLLPVGLNFYKSQQLETQAQAVIQTLRRAQLKAIAIELDSSFGVYFTDDNYTLFKGDSYLTRDIQYDEIFDFPVTIKISGLSEFVFLKSQGIPKENPSYCGGNCTFCNEFREKKSCETQNGCSWNARFKICEGICNPCNNYQNQPECENQLGCVWFPVSRGGEIILSSDSDERKININEIGRINLEL